MRRRRSARSIRRRKAVLAQAGTMSVAGCFQLLSFKESRRGRRRRHDRLRRRRACGALPHFSPARDGAALFPSRHRRQFPARCDSGRDPEDQVAVSRRLVGGAAGKVADIYRDEFSRARPNESPDAAGRALPGKRPDESSHLSSVRHPHSAAGRAQKHLSAARNRVRHLLSARIARAEMLRRTSVIVRAICRRPNGPRAKRWRCRSIRN